MFRKRRSKPDIRFIDEDGVELAPWKIRAEMLITATDYNDDGPSLLCTVTAVRDSEDW